MIGNSSSLHYVLQVTDSTTSEDRKSVPGTGLHSTSDPVARLSEREVNMMNIAIQTDGMLTVKEAAQLLYVHENTLRRWAGLRKIRAYRIGPRRDRRFRAEDIAALIREYDN